MDAYIACIGSGAMGSALMKAAAAAVGGARLACTDLEAKKAAALAADIGGRVFSSNTEAARSCRFLLLAVKPQVLPAVLAELAPVFGELLASDQAPVLLSIVAGVSIDSIRNQLLGQVSIPASAAKLQVLRLMPNMPALIGQGLIALSAEPGTAEETVSTVADFLSLAGIVERVAEKDLDAITAVCGSGPAYVYLFIEALADAAVRSGLSRSAALRYAARTVAGSAALVEQTNSHPALLKDQICSPAGTTIAGLAVLEDRAFRGAVIAAVEAAFNRAKAL